MVKKPGRGDGLKSNVVSLFTPTQGPRACVSLPEAVTDMKGPLDDGIKRLMIEPLDAVKAQINNNEVVGVILITVRSGAEVGGESYAGGPGVWGGLDRAIGLLELVKHQLIVEVGRDDLG